MFHVWYQGFPIDFIMTKIEFQIDWFGKNGGIAVSPGTDLDDLSCFKAVRPSPCVLRVLGYNIPPFDIPTQTRFDKHNMFLAVSAEEQSLCSQDFSIQSNTDPLIPTIHSTFWTDWWISWVPDHNLHQRKISFLISKKPAVQLIYFLIGMWRWILATRY